MYNMQDRTSYIKSSSNSRPYFFGALSSSSSASSLNKVSYDRAALSASRARASSASSFFCMRSYCEIWRYSLLYLETHLDSSSSTFFSIFLLDAVYSLLFMVNLSLYFRLIESIDDWVLALRNMDWMSLARSQHQMWDSLPRFT